MVGRPKKNKSWFPAFRSDVEACHMCGYPNFFIKKPLFIKPRITLECTKCNSICFIFEGKRYNGYPLSDLMQRGVKRVHELEWCQETYLRLPRKSLRDPKYLEPFAYLFDPVCHEAIGTPGKRAILAFDLEDLKNNYFFEYNGPLSKFDEGEIEDYNGDTPSGNQEPKKIDEDDARTIR